MFTVKVEKECGCFKREGYPSSKTFPTKDEALQEALAWSADMNETFCQKHNFSVVEEGDNTLLIKVDLN